MCVLVKVSRVDTIALCSYESALCQIYTELPAALSKRHNHVDQIAFSNPNQRVSTVGYYRILQRYSTDVMKILHAGMRN